MDPNENILGPTQNTPGPLAGKRQRFSGTVTPRDSNVSKNNIPVKYKIYKGVTLLNTINTTTNNQGVHTLEYTFPTAGNYTINTSVGDDSYDLSVTIGKTVDSVTATSDSNSAVAGSNVILTASVLDTFGNGHSNIPVTFNVKQVFGSLSSETQISDYNELEYSIPSSANFYTCEFKGKDQIAVSGQKADGTEVILYQMNSDTYKHIEIVDDRDILNLYVDGSLVQSISPYFRAKKLFIWGQGYVKDLEIYGATVSLTGNTTSTGNVSVNFTYPGGTCIVKASVTYGGETVESSSIQITEQTPVFDGISLTSDKPILSYVDNEQATLTAQLTNNGSPVNVSGETVVFTGDKPLSRTILSTGSDVIDIGDNYDVIPLGSDEIQIGTNDYSLLISRTTLIVNRMVNGASINTYSHQGKIHIEDGVLTGDGLTQYGNSVQSISVSEIDTSRLTNRVTGDLIDSYELVRTTNSSGVATVSYLGKAVGDLNIKAQCMSLIQTYALEDCKDYISGQSDESSKFGSSIGLRNNGSATLSYDSTNKYYKFTNNVNNSESFIPLNNATGLDDFIIEFDAMTDSTNGVMGLDTYYNSTNWLRLSNLSNKKSYYHNNNGSASENEENSSAVGTNRWVHFKFTITNDTITKEIYYNDTLQETVSQSVSSSWFDNSTKYGISVLWGTGWSNHSFLKNFKIKPL